MCCGVRYVQCAGTIFCKKRESCGTGESGVVIVRQSGHHVKQVALDGCVGRERQREAAAFFIGGVRPRILTKKRGVRSCDLLVGKDATAK